MANLLDYLYWRGDLTFEQTPFNEVDNLILSELSYLDFGGIVPAPGMGEGLSLREAAQAFFARVPAGEKIDMGVLLPDEIPEMLRRMAQSDRFQNVKLNCYEVLVDTGKDRQFAALTVELGGNRAFLSYRGTDDTLAGWREDFYMACLPEIPAQKLALDYLKRVARQYPRWKLQLGGHSKGGNLAVYAAVFCPRAIQRRIEAVWSNDGPGFYDHIISLPEYERISDRIITIVPKSSMVGMLLEHEEDYIVVDSDQDGWFQHDGFSWKVLGPRFIQLRSVTKEGRLNDLVMRDWLENLTLEQRERFVNGLFDVLQASGAKTLTDLREDGLKGAENMLRAMKDMDKQTRDVVREALKLLLKSNIRIRLEDLRQESEKIEWPKWKFGEKE